MTPESFMSHLELHMGNSHMRLKFKHLVNIGHGMAGFHKSHESNVAN